jgi:molecular chaperone GrpE
MTESEKQFQDSPESPSADPFSEASAAEVVVDMDAAASEPDAVSREPLTDELTDAVTMDAVSSEVVPGEEAAGEGAALDAEAAPAAFDALELDPNEPDPDEISPAALKVESLNRELQATREKLEEGNAQYLRITADFENFRKRTRKEQDEQEERVKCATILKMLPVIDNFERARVQLKPEGESATNIHKSYQGIYKQLVESLKQIGVSPMRAEGKDFDPMLHEAVMREPTDEHPDGTVMEELQRGYLLGDRVLRHAMVKVSVAMSSAPDAENSPEA